MGQLLNSAADPHQYDKAEAGWAQEGKGLESPSRAYFWHYLQPVLGEVKGKILLDIGSGTGWFLDLAQRLGAQEAVGIEPSQKNIEISHSLYPNTQTIQSTLEDFTASQQFDVITSIMSFVHVRDIDAAFRKLDTLLCPEGRILAVVYDFEYTRRPRFDYKIQIEELNDEEYVVMIERKDVSIADIVRSTPRFERAAQQVDLRLTQDIPIVPTDAFIAARPHYEQFRNTPTHRLLVFER